MLTREEARSLVVEELHRMDQSPDRRRSFQSNLDELAIMDDLTAERPWGWVFFYTTRGAILGETNFRYKLAGNAPIMVNKVQGILRDSGTSETIEYYTLEYEADLARREHLETGILSRFSHAFRRFLAWIPRSIRPS